MSDEIRLDFQVLIYREDEFWIAHCLETDLVGEGKTADEAMRTLIDISNVQIQAALDAGDLASIFSPAPPELWRSYAVARERISNRPEQAIKPVNRLSVRELALV
jgi:hypothetical protein